MSFSMLNFSMACVAHSTASCCISSVMSAFFITAFLSVICKIEIRKKAHSLNKPNEKRGTSPYDHAYVQGLDTMAEKRFAFLTLSKNSFPQLLQIFATEITFSNNYLKVKQNQHRFHGVLCPRRSGKQIADISIGALQRLISVDYIKPRCIAGFFPAESLETPEYLNSELRNTFDNCNTWCSLQKRKYKI